MTEPLDATLGRLAQERDEADRRYNEALTELDRALPRPPPLPDPLPGFDERQRASLNEAWNTLPSPPSASGWQGRIAGFVWKTVAPYLQRQLTFNSLLVDHVNRTVDAQRAAHQRQAEAAAALRGYLEALGILHGRLLVYLQQITAYADTRDRHAFGGALVLNAAISDLADGQARYRESLEARAQRSEARAAQLTAAHEDLRGMLATAQQAIAVLKRAVEGRPASASPSEASAAPAVPAPSLEAYKYVGFEDQFRGSQALIRERQTTYLPFFATGATARGPVLDIGCGRGEFIELLQAHGREARGIDLNEEMVEVCRARGLDVTHADAVTSLSAAPDASLGGIFAAQVVEHLEPAYLLRLLDLAFDKLQPGGTLLLETLNPACWTAFFESYLRDITHRWPLHPDTLKYLVMASGFTRVDLEFRSPVPPQDRLQPVAVPAGADAALTDLAETFNANVEKLNARLFTHMDYAVVAVKGAGAP